jgi:RNA polymerase sigma-70 factor (ECF subfamily)
LLLERRIGQNPSQPRPRLLDPSREASLRERLVARDERALVELVDLASPWLLNIARAMLGDEDTAEEVVMETFRTAWNTLPTVPKGEHTGLMPYLMRVTRHRAIDVLRRRQRRARRMEAFAAEAPDAAPPTEPNEAAEPGWAVHRQVHSALEELPQEQRAVVQLAYFQGLTQSEIAESLDIPLGTVKTRLRLAFGKLREKLAGLRDWVL